MSLGSARPPGQPTRLHFRRRRPCAPRPWQPLTKFPDRHHRGSTRDETTELLPCGRIADRRHNPQRRCSCERELPEPPPSRTEGPAPRRDKSILLPRPNSRGSTNRTAAELEGRNHRQSGSPVVAASPLRFLCEAVLAEWLRQRQG